MKNYELRVELALRAPNFKLVTLRGRALRSLEAAFEAVFARAGVASLRGSINFISRVNPGLFLSYQSVDPWMPRPMET